MKISPESNRLELPSGIAVLDWDFETEAKFGVGAEGTPNCDAIAGEHVRQTLLAVAPPEVWKGGVR